MAKTPNLLNNLLKAFRIRKFGKTPLIEVAETVGVKPDYLSKVESGTLEKPSEENLFKMLDAYGCSPVWRNSLHSLWGHVVDGAVGFDDLDRPPLTISGGDVGDMFTRRIVTGAIPSTILYTDHRHETLITPAALFASWDMPVGTMIGGSFRPTRWIDQEFTARQFRELLSGESRSVYLLPMNFHHRVITDGHSCVECIEDFLLVYDGGLRPSHTAASDDIELFLEEFETMKAAAYPPDVALQVVAAMRDAWLTVYQTVHPPMGQKTRNQPFDTKKPSAPASGTAAPAPKRKKKA